jgi:hypothetical protein
MPAGLVDDPTCEGFHARSLRTSKVGTGSAQIVTSHKGNDRRLGQPPVAEPPRTTCPKTLDKFLIQAALKFKGFGGSVVMERICCGKPGCHCRSEALHGPYPYLHYYSNGKVKRRYLSKTVSALLSHSSEELEKMLQETLLGPKNLPLGEA